MTNSRTPISPHSPNPPSPPLPALPPRLAARLLDARRHKGPSPGLSPKSPHLHLHPHSLHRRRPAVEARREKLAARSAHAELVRNRAAAERARAAGDLSARVARALEVSRAREQRLKAVASTAAAEVRRAKRVAQETRERELEVARKVRETAEERLARAAERRQQLQSRSPRMYCRRQIDAAMIIQRVWRKHRLQVVSRRWQAHGLAGPSAIQRTFEQLTMTMRNQDVLRDFYNLLIVLGASINKTDVRAILCAHLLVSHASEVLSFWGPTEESLVDLATQLVSAIDSLQSRGLTELVVDFLKLFATWKEEDSAVMVKGLVGAFVELDGISRIVKDDVAGGAAEEYDEGIRLNQTLILQQLGQLVGRSQAHELLRDAVRERRNQDRLMRPRHSRNRSGGLRRSQGSVSLRTLSSSGNVRTDAGDGDEAVAAIQFALPVSGGMTDGNVTLERPLHSFLPDNRQLVHELALNPMYRIPPPSDSARDSIYHTLTTTVVMPRPPEEQEIWILSMAENIRHRLLSLLNAQSQLISEVEQLVGFSAVKAALDSNQFSLNFFFMSITNLLSRLCAPFRDEDVASLGQFLQEDDASDGDKLKRLLDVLDLLLVDHSNFLFSGVVPVLLRHGRDYEARIFDNIASTTGLPKLTSIWSGHYGSVLSEVARRDPGSIGLDPVTPGKVYVKMILSLITIGPLSRYAVPETLDLDYDRFSKVSQHVARVVAVGAILLTAKNMLRRDVRENWLAECGRIWAVLDTVVADMDQGLDLDLDSLAGSVVRVLTMTHPMPVSSTTVLSNIVKRILSVTIGLHSLSAIVAAQTQPTPSDPTVKLLLNRLCTVLANHIPSLKAVITGGGGGSTVTSPTGQSVPTQLVTGRGNGRINISRPASAAATSPALMSALGAAGLTEVATKIDDGIVKVVDPVVKLDWEWKRTWYDRMTEHVATASPTTPGPPPPSPLS